MHSVVLYSKVAANGSLTKQSNLLLINQVEVLDIVPMETVNREFILICMQANPSSSEMF